MFEIRDWLALNNGLYGAKSGEFSEVVIENLIARYARPGDIAVDCGAADGRMLRRMLAAVGDDGVAVAFEPIPHVFDRLRQNFSSENTILMQMCVSDAIRADVTFYHARNRRWISSLSPDQLAGYDVEEISVPTSTMDSVLLNHEKTARKTVGFIKLDIEGAEFNAIRGGRTIIERDRPFIVFENGLESASRSFAYTREEFLGFFDALGYRLFDVFGVSLTGEFWNAVGKKIAWNFVAAHRDDPRLADFLNCIEDILVKSRNALSPAPARYRRIIGTWRRLADRRRDPR